MKTFILSYLFAVLLLTGCAGKTTMYHVATTPDGMDIKVADVHTGAFTSVSTAWAEDPMGKHKPIPFHVGTGETALKTLFEVAAGIGAAAFVYQAIGEVDFTTDVSLK